MKRAEEEEDERKRELQMLISKTNYSTMVNGTPPAECTCVPTKILGSPDELVCEFYGKKK